MHFGAHRGVFRGIDFLYFCIFITQICEILSFQIRCVPLPLGDASLDSPATVTAIKGKGKGMYSC